MLGPIDYIAVAFEGNNFDGSILDELAMAVESGAIRVVDLIFVIKDSEGNFAAAEIEDQSPALKEAAIALGITDELPLFSEADIKKVAAKLDLNSTAGLLVIEQLWAKGLKKALLEAGGTLLDEGRIHPDKIAAAHEELQHIAV
jgi:hypothetical protein